MSVHSAAFFPGAFYFYAMFSSLNGIIGILALQDQIRVPIEVLVFDQRTRMARQARRQHIRHHSGHGRRPQHIVHTMQSFFQQELVHIKKEIINVLHSDLEILEP